MAGMNYTFDAQQYTPSQGMGVHPPGVFAVVIATTAIVPTKENDSGMFAVTFQSDSGSIVRRFNLWNKSQQAVDIANRELSAMCHAIGIFKVEMQSEGANIRGARLLIEVRKQANSEYMEVGDMADMNGNVPGKPGVVIRSGQATQQQQPAAFQSQQQPAQAGTAMQPNAGSGWSGGQPAQQPQTGFQQQHQPAPNQPQGWQGQTNQPQGQAQPQGQPAGQGGASWSQQPAGQAQGGGAPSWAR